ncbi:MAG: hypothetical protein MK076_03285 [Flavobacteriales bacterium]|nr:hypothetical protein [Flavobacteriales bacterium]
MGFKTIRKEVESAPQSDNAAKRYYAKIKFKDSVGAWLDCPEFSFTTKTPDGQYVEDGSSTELEGQLHGVFYNERETNFGTKKEFSIKLKDLDSDEIVYLALPAKLKYTFAINSLLGAVQQASEDDPMTISFKLSPDTKGHKIAVYHNYSYVRGAIDWSELPPSEKVNYLDEKNQVQTKMSYEPSHTRFWAAKVEEVDFRAGIVKKTTSASMSPPSASAPQPKPTQHVPNAAIAAARPDVDSDDDDLPF